jgi:hypothetical protein
MAKRFVFILTILGIIILGVYILYLNYYLPTKYTLPSPLENVEFPTEQEQYPADWLEEFKFPSDFILVDSSSGALPESTVQGWAAKFRYQGTPSEATKAISSYLEKKGWTIVESNELDSSGFSFLIQREKGNGIIIIDTDPNNASQTLVIATIFP